MNEEQVIVTPDPRFEDYDRRFARMATAFREISARVEALTEENLDLKRDIQDIDKALGTAQLHKTYNRHQVQSESIDKLLEALAIAQGQMGKVETSGSSGKGKASSLSDYRAAASIAFCNNNITIDFLIENNEYGEGVCTMLIGHSSGQFMERSLALMVDKVSDNAGDWHRKRSSAITYTMKHMYRGLITEGDETE